MIFLNCSRESIVQIGDKTRIDVSRSFVNGASVTDILIKPEATEASISVFNTNQDKWYIDWAYSTDGEKTITVEATDGVNTISQNFKITVISEEDDNLYSTDSQIFSIESELKRYIPLGKSSFNNAHREAQSRILTYLDRKRVWNENGEAYTKDQLNVVGDLTKWSLYEALFVIYTDLFISVGDKFAEKVNQYKELKGFERERSAVRIDKDKSGTIESSNEFQDLKSFRLIKR
jgi:hypothetical protein